MEGLKQAAFVHVVEDLGSEEDGFMTLDEIVTAPIYLLAVITVFVISKLIYDLTNRRFKLKEELVKKDNFALALAVSGYYFGIVIAIGGAIVGDSAGLVDDLIDIFFYGIIAVIAMNISMVINDKIILYKFDNVNARIVDRNAGTGIVEFGNYIAVGLIIYGAISGEGGTLVTAIVFWILGLASLIIASFIYNIITPYDVHEHIEKDNIAVGIAFSGMLIGIGNIVRFSIAGDFTSWSENIINFAAIVILGLLLMPLIRFVCDMVLLPGEKLTKEIVGQDKPNLGAASIEALSYIAASFFIGWCI